MKDYRYIVEQFKPNPNGSFILQRERFFSEPGVVHALWFRDPNGGSREHRVRIIDDYEATKRDIKQDMID